VIIGSWFSVDVTGTPLVVGGVIVIGDINNRVRLNGKLTVFEEERFFLPAGDLDIAGHINGSRPPAITEGPADNPVDCGHPAVDFNFSGGGIVFRSELLYIEGRQITFFIRPWRAG
jgi:hypothetical protein